MSRILLFLLASAAIFEARPAALPFMVLAALLAVAVSQRLPSRTTAPLHPLRLLEFVPYFLGQSVRAGADVAVRAFLPGPRMSPGFIEYETGIANPAARVAFVNAVSLMPGTLTAQLEGARLTVHTLDAGADHEPRLRELERRLAPVFGEVFGEVGR